MRRKILSCIFDFVEKHTIIVILSSLFFGILFFLAFKFIPLQSDYIDLLPPDSEPVKKLRYLSNELKGVGQFSIVIEPPSQSLTSAHVIKTIQRTPIMENY